MSFDDELVCAMAPGWHEIDELSAIVRASYSATMFGLERLESFGFAVGDKDDRFALTPLGIKLRDILQSRP